MKRTNQQQKDCIRTEREGAQKRLLLSEILYKHLPHRRALNRPLSLVRLNQGILSRKFFIFRPAPAAAALLASLARPLGASGASQEFWQSKCTHSFKRPDGDGGGGSAPDWELPRGPNPNLSEFLYSLLDSAPPRRSTAPKVQGHPGAGHTRRAGSHSTPGPPSGLQAS